MTRYDDAIIKSDRERASHRISHIYISFVITSYYHPHIAVRIIVLIRICHGSVIVHPVSIRLVDAVVYFFIKHSIERYSIASRYEDYHIGEIA